MTGRICPICERGFSGGKHNKKYCSESCQAEAARRRASAWYESRRGDADPKQRVAAASRRHHQRIMADPQRYATHRAATRVWRAANPEKVRQAERSYWQTNAGKKREKDQRRRARKLAAFVEDVSIDVLWVRDEGMCGICGEQVDLTVPWPDRLAATIDHVIALARGGEHSYTNAQLAHAVCNSRKGDRPQLTSRRDAGRRDGTAHTVPIHQEDAMSGNLPTPDPDNVEALADAVNRFHQKLSPDLHEDQDLTRMFAHKVINNATVVVHYTKDGDA